MGQSVDGVEDAGVRGLAQECIVWRAEDAGLRNL